MTTHKLDAQNVNVYYDQAHVIRDVSLTIEANTVTAFIGPSGCGKSTFLRLINRMNDYIDGFRKTGTILIDGEDIYDKKVRVEELRKKIGMVFQKPNPFPKSIYDNIAWGARINGYKENMDDLVEESLRKAALWDEVKDDLRKNGLSLSGGQQQRLCIARVLALQPEVIILDEPSSALDPVTTAKIEEFLHQAKQQYTILLVPHNIQQASRMADYAAFFLQGKLIEYGTGEQIFLNPKDARTRDYVEGRFG